MVILDGKDNVHVFTPRAMGYRMPAEWEKQEAVWLSWPHDTEWRGEEEVSEVEQVYGQFAKALCSGQMIRILSANNEVEQRARGVLGQYGVENGKVEFYPIRTGKIYIRDYGPTFVVRKDTGEKALVNWEFNAWGSEYENSLQDTQVPEMINEYLHLPFFSPGIIMEGGAIEVNGCGTVLTMEAVLLNKNRNVSLKKKELEKYLCDYLGVSNVLWLNRGLEGDDRNGRIDDIARFVNPTTVVCAYEEDPEDVNFARLHENYERLLKMRDVQGKFFNVLKLPMAYVESDEHIHTGSLRKPASYLNFYIGNNAVVVPTFGEDNVESEVEALRKLQAIFLTRKVVGVDCSKMVLEGRTLHCASQQEPAGRKF